MWTFGINIMPQIVLMSIVGVSLAIAVGYLGAAAMATEVGRIVLGVLAALVAVITIVESMRMIETSRRI